LEFEENKYYNGFELWNEFRTGYTIDFKIREQPLYVNLQMLAGFGLFPGNKPESFKKQSKEEGIFISPIFFIGTRF
jgi:hypothetical protein